MHMHMRSAPSTSDVSEKSKVNYYYYNIYISIFVVALKGSLSEYYNEVYI